MNRYKNIVLILLLGIVLAGCNNADTGQSSYNYYDSDYADTYETNPTNTPEPTPTSIPEDEIVEIRVAKVGDYVILGSYEQDNDENNGKEPIEWLVLEKLGYDNKMLLISKYALEWKPYHDQQNAISWQYCTLRNWLNYDFISNAFTTEEKARIIKTKVKAEENSRSNTDAGNDTDDLVFLLNEYEMDRYFSAKSDGIFGIVARACSPSKYAISLGCPTSTSRETCQWWLRSPGSSTSTAMAVSETGYFRINGEKVSNCYAVRPAIWIEIFTE